VFFEIMTLILTVVTWR